MNEHVSMEDLTAVQLREVLDLLLFELGLKVIRVKGYGNDLFIIRKRDHE